jgi:hypothetical protein
VIEELLQPHIHVGGGALIKHRAQPGEQKVVVVCVIGRRCSSSAIILLKHLLI